jgi:hypothetical protein
LKVRITYSTDKSQVEYVEPFQTSFANILQVPSEFEKERSSTYPSMKFRVLRVEKID